MNPPWTQTIFDRAVALFMAGDSATIVAETLNKEFGLNFTRCAILGKLNRAGISRGKAQPLRKMDHSGMPAIRSFGNRGNYGAPRPKKVKASRPVVVEVVEVDLDAIPFMQLGKETCRWPAFGVGADTHFCGRNSGEATYCRAHTKLAWKPGSKATPTQMHRSVRRWVA